MTRTEQIKKRKTAEIKDFPLNKGITEFFGTKIPSFPEASEKPFVYAVFRDF